MRGSGVWHMTASTAGRRSPARIWIGPSRILVYTTRHSRAGLERSPDARCAFKTITRQISARATQNRPMFGWLPDMSYWPHQFAMLQSTSSYTSCSTAHTPSQEVCRRFNSGHCTKQRCRYAHSCSGCGGPHVLINCGQRIGSLATGQSRSPPRPTASHTLQTKRY